MNLQLLAVSVFVVLAAGDVTGGLKETNGNDACKYAPKGAQVYGRAGWHKDLWAIMYSWYFPKGFNWLSFPTKPHNWKSVVVWIDNPDVETPKIGGVSLSKSNTEYHKVREMSNSNFVGSQVEITRRRRRRRYRTYTPGSSTNVRCDNVGGDLFFALRDGDYQDLIMWEQLMDAARVALNNSESFGDAEVPFSDEHFKGHLDKAWPL
ncbi:hypothetical protein DVH05_026346 [Phytophthora capsici]|nr:hypothetical protein DVH05_026346 [Phytophthora capsici]